MMKFFCYTTVFNAIEVFSLARNEAERHALESAMSSMKILGLNAKNAKQYGELLLKSANMATMALLTAGVCLESKLSLLTDHPEDFRSVKGLKIIRPSMITENALAAEILSGAKIIT
jgi:predicted nucleic acid-binding protein